ncbi:hypothetical protein [Sporomusa sp. KB1]|jgi:hypothetical protein|uniref:hypothetical protein n=1 Tax=Sporomusa sp. KB1 TaxID=943346 RepID=UPI00119D7A00|nr:hypothetical protein [Sporomusa sp. KB1]TWH49160.1 hypothetical protein Salpa_5361 [Sporomusa sp. KB1]
MSENLFAYTITNYSASAAGAIVGDRSSASVDTTAVIKIFDAETALLNGDAAFFNFFQGLNSRLVLRQYNYSTTSLIANQIIAPQGTWTSPLASQTWSAVANLHAVATSGSYLYATGYDLAKIARVLMTSDTYSQQSSYDFPSELAVTGTSYHGEGLAVYNGFLYALFTCNPGGGYSTYDDSYVVQYEIKSDGTLEYIDYIRVGKNAFTLELYGNKLYICALGGMQNAGSYNTATCLSIVTIDDDDAMSVANVSLASGMSGDFRDITIANSSNAYILLGYYDSSYANLVGKIYHSTVANLSSPANWTEVVSINNAGYLWGIQAEASPTRLWYIKGNLIDVYGSLPTTTGSTPTSFSTSNLAGSTGYTALNSACFIAPDTSLTAASAARPAHVAKSFASHIRLAREARELAEKLAVKK